MHQPKNFLTLIFLLLIEATSHGAEIPNDLDGRSVGKVVVPQKLTVKELQSMANHCLCWPSHGPMVFVIHTIQTTFDLAAFGKDLWVGSPMMASLS